MSWSADIKKRHPDRIMEDLFQYHEQYQFDRIVIEEVQFQELFKDQVIKEGAKQRGIYLADPRRASACGQDAPDFPNCNPISKTN